MTVKQSTIYYSLGCVLITGIFLFAVNLMCLTDSNGKGQHIETNKPYPHEKRQRPIIIWFHNAASKKTNAQVLEKAISNGIVSHVLLLYLHPLDAPLKGPVLVKVREAVEVCKKYKTKIIWFRTLWPTYKVKSFTEQMLYDENYYASLIRIIREEAQTLKADYVGIDTEPYGYFPYKKKFKKQPLSQKNYEQMQDAVNLAMQSVGAVDFLTPAGRLRGKMFDAVSGLGNMKIAGFTYYDAPWTVSDPNTPFDIFGAYVSISKHNKAAPKYSYFTAREILERQKLWSHKKGVMLYPKDDEIEAIAEQISKIKEIVPRND